MFFFENLLLENTYLYCLFLYSLKNIQNGDFLMNLLPITCQKGVVRDAKYPTASCTVIFDGIGDSKLFLATMDIHKSIDSQMVSKNIFL